MTLLNRFTSGGPKRILSLDGGGIRGTLSIGYLEKIESILRERHGKPELRLCDYFDLIGGTSTGAIIAALLAVGMETAQLKALYLELGGKVFSKKWRWWMFWRLGKALQAAFEAEPLIEELEAMFGNTTLGNQDRIKTGICVVVKRVDTGSTWLLFNHPDGKHYQDNQQILLRDAIRASTAAPVISSRSYLRLVRAKREHSSTGA